MTTRRVEGFSKLAVMAIIASIILLVVCVFVASLFVRQSQVDSASAVAQEIVNDLESGDVNESIDLLASSITDDSSTYYTWIMWSTAFSSNDIAIEQPATSVDYSFSPIDVFSGSKPVSFTYATSSDLSIKLILQSEESGWVLVDYEAL
tara:strand:+ start:93 stop:539 length:447 start_codon:yes stop_codon:yes gene_type:complete